MVEKSRLSLLSKFLNLRTKSVRHYKFQWWFHLPNVLISRIHFIMTCSTFLDFFVVVTKITKYWNASHNANSQIFLSSSFTLGQTDYVHKKFHFNSSCASRDISQTVEIGVLFCSYTNGYVELSSASVTSCLSHCSLVFYSPSIKGTRIQLRSPLY